ncbi:MAG: polysaccharide deacetylase family protein [Bacteroidetes bacterium]|nr:polysaccharide deacetylase family protein [Bacteroidota bacterium]
MSEFQLPILLYHRIVNENSKIGKHKIYVWEKNFRAQMKFLKENGYETITFEKLSQPSNLPTFQPSIILTFDDGYEDNYTILFPVLKEFGFTAVIFLVTKQTRNEWAMKEGEPELKMMNKEMIKEMSGYGIEFGGHTRTHVDLKKTPKEKFADEIAGCKKDVEEITGKPVVSFAYPFGAHNIETEQAVQNAGYKYGISTIFGPANLQEDLMRIRRIEIRPKDGLSKFKFKARGYYFQKSYLQNLFS